MPEEELVFHALHYAVLQALIGCVHILPRILAQPHLRLEAQTAQPRRGMEGPGVRRSILATCSRRRSHDPPTAVARLPLPRLRSAQLIGRSGSGAAG